MLKPLVLLVITAVLVLFSLLFGHALGLYESARNPGQAKSAETSAVVAGVFVLVAAALWLIAAFNWSPP